MTLHSPPSLIPALLLMVFVFPSGRQQLHGDDLQLELRSQRRSDDNIWVRSTEHQTWLAAETAVIVCDVWDKHHCLNAVRRLEEFTPRMNDVLIAARNRGATIIHSPSDCMPGYADHPARLRAIGVPPAKSSPKDVEYWCSQIPAEEKAEYPIDQSDGGEDDDPSEHAKWAAELTAIGRNPGMPWKMQSPLIEIDRDHDFISDKGDEVWNILESRGIKNVILVGVHTNMCVLGRPFGLRQMVRGGRNVALMRDMTDCMYNPGRWPFVDHFTGNDLIISHVERFVCPTITSDQFLGGTPFRSRFDARPDSDVMSVPVAEVTGKTFQEQWTTVQIGTPWKDATHGKVLQHNGTVWFRCTIRLPRSWVADGITRLVVSDRSGGLTAWLNGIPLVHAASDAPSMLRVPNEAIVADDINLLVIRAEFDAEAKEYPMPQSVINGEKSLSLDGRWQVRIGDDPAWSNIPLPAKFGVGSDVLFEPR